MSLKLQLKSLTHLHILDVFVAVGMIHNSFLAGRSVRNHTGDAKADCALCFPNFVGLSKPWTNGIFEFVLAIEPSFVELVLTNVHWLEAVYFMLKIRVAFVNVPGIFTCG